MESLSPAVFEILRSKRIGVTSLTFDYFSLLLILLYSVKLLLICLLCVSCCVHLYPWAVVSATGLSVLLNTLSLL